LITLLALLAGAAEPLSIPHESYTLDNGMHVILVEDHSLPQVVINIWYRVGAKDELVGRTGFAHLFEHLMFMGTTRLPDSGFDDLMESAGGWNNAWTSEDATDYYDVGPSNLLDTFLWMEADRIEGLAGAMTQAKLDLQREVVRNERRQSYEDSPYGEVWLALPEIMYPEGHPYAHSVIGSHEDLQAASVEDVVTFFDTWYVPNNASLVVAGDIDVAQTKARIQAWFGSLESRPVPERTVPAPLDKPVKSFTEMTDNVPVARSMMLWHTPPAFEPGDATMDVVAAILSGGELGRLNQRLVVQDQVAVQASAAQYSQKLQSMFVVDLIPAEGQELEAIENVAFEEIQRLATDGPTTEEMERVLNQNRVSAIRGLESLDARASALNRYWFLTGNADYLATDLGRYDDISVDEIKAAASSLMKERAAVIHVLPEGGDE